MLLYGMEKVLYKVMGLDYGEVRIGISFSDMTRLIASPFETFTRKNLDYDLAYLSNLIKEKGVKKVVFGLPLNMDGSEGERVQATREFAKQLVERSGIAVDFMDERLTSVSAENILVQANVRRDKRKKVIDKLAATIILQEYLDTHKGE